MKISDIAECLNAKVIVAKHMDRQITSACGADLMSDVLAFVKSNAVLLTGLINQHVIRTAEMIDISCIVFVRGKTPPDELCQLAEEKEIAILMTECSMFESCGKLYKRGLPACMDERVNP